MNHFNHFLFITTLLVIFDITRSTGGFLPQVEISEPNLSLCAADTTTAIYSIINDCESIYNKSQISNISFCVYANITDKLDQKWNILIKTADNTPQTLRYWFYNNCFLKLKDYGKYTFTYFLWPSEDYLTLKASAKNYINGRQPQSNQYLSDDKLVNLQNSNSNQIQRAKLKIKRKSNFKRPSFERKAINQDTILSDQSSYSFSKQKGVNISMQSKSKKTSSIQNKSNKTSFNSLYPNLTCSYLNQTMNYILDLCDIEGQQNAVQCITQNIQIHLGGHWTTFISLYGFSYSIFYHYYNCYGLYPSYGKYNRYIQIWDSNFL